MTQFVHATVVTCAALAMSAHAQTAALVPAQSEIAFTSTQMGVPVEGRFRRYDAKITLDPKQLANASVAFTIDTGSASLGVPGTDAELVKPNWFDATRFPQATFRSSAVKGVGPGRYEVAGTLTLKGQAQPLVVPVTVTHAGTLSTATGSFTLKRLGWHIGEAEWADTSLVADAVAVRFKLVLTGLPPF